MSTDNYKHAELTDKIIKAFYTVYNRLGYGFLEKVYENALQIELKKEGLEAKKQTPVSVYYDGKEVGHYFADLIVDDLVIVELKACNGFLAEHEAQLTNYLRATKMEVGLLLNFGVKAQVKRKVFSNEYKTL
jgi:GxxExxY protein